MKILLSLLRVKVLLVSFLYVQMAFAQFGGGGGGAGTLSNPYRLSYFSHLEALSDSVKSGRDYTGVHFRLTQNIDASATSDKKSSSYNSGKGFQPIGSENAQFKGHLSGNGFVVRNLTIDRPNDECVGLIGYAGSGSTINFLGIVGGSVHGESHVGGLVGLSKGNISNSYATCNVSSYTKVNSSLSSLSNNFFRGGPASYSGGLVGSSSGKISNCYATGDVSAGSRHYYVYSNSTSSKHYSAASYSGGLVGFSEGEVYSCYATGNVSTYSRSAFSYSLRNTYVCRSYSGGLVGSSSGKISNCYARGSVSASSDESSSGTYSSHSGGLVGIFHRGEVSNSYATGRVPSNYTNRGLVGTGHMSGYSNYWDENTTEQIKSQGGGVGKTSEQMKNSVTYIGWDFDNTWGIHFNVNNGYPYHKWQGHTVRFVGGSGGTVSPSDAQNSVNNISTTAVIATANDGYHFTNWTASPAVDGHVIAGNIVNSFVPIRDVTFTANFVRKTYEIRYVVANNAGGSVNGNSFVTHGETLSGVSVIPADGWDFVNWTALTGGANVVGHSNGTFTSTSATLAGVSVTGAVTFVATFKKKAYKVKYQLAENSANAGATLTGGTTSTTSGTLSTAPDVTANHGWTFSKWTASNTNLVSNLPETGNEWRNVQITGDVTFLAHYTRTVTIEVTSGSSGKVNSLGTAITEIETDIDGIIPELTAIATDGWLFKNWTLGEGATQSSIAIDNDTLSTVTARKPVTITANFVKNTYTLTYTAGANGMLTGSTTQTGIVHGTAGSAVEAVANAGFMFSKWSDDVTSNPRTDLNVMNDVDVTAEYTAKTYTLTYRSGDEGIIYGIHLQTLLLGGDGSSVIAVANDGYEFARWSDNVLTANRIDIDVAANIDVTAEYSSTVALEIVETPTYEVSHLAISPNPVSRSSGAVTIYFPQNILGTGTCTIYDTQGNRIDHQAVNIAQGKAIHWDLCNEQGRRVAAGGYLAILQITDNMGMVHFQKAMIGVKQ